MTKSLKFTPRASEVLPDHRPIYKISQLLLVLNISSRSGKSTAARLQLFSWALKSDERQAILVRASKSGRLETPVWGFDPTVVAALRVAQAEGLLTRKGRDFVTSETGRDFSTKVLEDSLVMRTEKEFLNQVGKKITQKMVDATMDAWARK